jgi:hypothetical protein
MKTKTIWFVVLLAVSLSAASCSKDNGPAREAVSNKDTHQEAYIYGFPMIAAYKAMYQFNVDKSNSQYKTAFNQIRNDVHVFTPKDTGIVTPNSDTPYSMVQVDLRAEPIVFCVPKVEKGRYYSVQLTDMYSFNYGYVGSRATCRHREGISLRDAVWLGDLPHATVQRRGHQETQPSILPPGDGTWKPPAIQVAQ